MRIVYLGLLSVLAVVYAASIGHAQSVVWERPIARSTVSWAPGTVTPDGGVLTVITNSDQSSRTLYRTNANSSIQWSHGISNQVWLVFMSAQDRNTYVLIHDGQTVANTLSLCLFDSLGTQLWKRSISIAGDSAGLATALLTRSDGSAVIFTTAGIAIFDTHGVKLSESRTKEYGFDAVAPGIDNGWYAAMRDTIYSFSPAGQLRWKRAPITSGTSGIPSIIYSVKSTHDSGLVVISSGYVERGPAYSGDLLVSKVDRDGNLRWTHTISGAGFSLLGQNGQQAQLCESRNGEVVALYTGLFGYSPEVPHVYLLRLSEAGSVLETHPIEVSATSTMMQIADIAPASDSEFTVLWNYPFETTSMTDVDVSQVRLGYTPAGDRRWIYRIDGRDVFTFDATTRWKGRTIPKQQTPQRRQISVVHDTVRINNFLTFVGDIAVDSSDHVNVSGTGTFFVPSFVTRLNPLKSIDTLRNIVLYNGTFSFGLGSSTITEFVNAKLPEKFFGCSIVLDSLRLVGGLEAYGVAVAGHFSLPNAFPFSDTTSSIGIYPLVITRDSIQWRGRISNLQLLPNWKLTNLSGSYDSYNDSLRLNCSLTLPMLKDVSAAASIREGRLAAAETSVEPTQPVPIGIGGFTMTKFAASVTGLQSPPMDAIVSGSFSSTPENIISLDMLGRYVAGDRIGMRVNAKLYFVLGAWQAQAQLNGRFHFNSNIELAGLLDLINFGTGSLFSGNAALQYVAQPKPQLSGSIQGTLDLPKLPGERDNPAIRWFNTIAGLPYRFANMTLIVQDSICHASLDADLGVANVGVVINPLRPWGDTNLVRVTARFKELPHFGTTQKHGDSPQSGIATEDSTRVTTPLDKLVIEVRSSGVVPVSSIVSPDGTTYLSSSAPRVNYTRSTDGHDAFWTVVTPASGTWHLLRQSALPGDTVSFYGAEVDSALAIHASVAGGMLTVNSEGSSYYASTDYYLDTDSAGLDGLYLGSAMSGAPFVATLPHTLPDCRYFVYAVRSHNAGYDDLSITTTYASEAITVDKPELTSPTSVAASINSTGRIHVSWLNPATPAANVSYAIHLTDHTGNDSIYALASSQETSADFNATAGESFIARIQSIDSNGVAGCASESVPVLLGVEPTGLYVDQQELNVFPNPALAYVNVAFACESRMIEEIMVFDILGHTVAHIPAAAYERGSHAVRLDLAALPAGTYYVRLAGDLTTTRSITVR